MTILTGISHNIPKDNLRVPPHVADWYEPSPRRRATSPEQLAALGGKRADAPASAPVDTSSSESASATVVNTSSSDEAIIRDYLSGIHTKEIFKKHNISSSKLIQVLKDNNVALRRSKKNGAKVAVPEPVVEETVPIKATVPVVEVASRLTPGQYLDAIIALSREAMENVGITMTGRFVYEW